jgi:hypothetical protein
MAKMEKLKRAVCRVGSYQKDGAEKGRYQNIGTLFRRDDGSLTLKLDVVPVGCPEWNGWVSFYDFDERGGQQAAAPTEQKFDDDIPF